MDSQMPRRFRKEQEAILAKYMALPDGTKWDLFFQKNASKEFLTYCEEKRKRDLRLLSHGIIEN